MKLHRAFFAVSGMTMVSRLTGLIRDVLMAGVLGAGWVSDAFFVAFRLPNLFRRLFAEGSFSNGFVPILVEKFHQEKGDIQPGGPFLTFSGQMLSLMFAVMIALNLLAQLFMPWIMRMLAPGFAMDAEKIALCIEYARISFSYLALVALASVYAGMLQVQQKFMIAAFAPSTLNLTFIFALWLHQGENEIAVGYALSWATISGGILHLGLLMWSWIKKWPMPKIEPIRRDASQKEFERLFWPAFITGGVVQINIMISGILASYYEGAISYIYYADRIYQLPLSLIGAALGTVLLPRLTHDLHSRPDHVYQTVNRGVVMGIWMMMPCVVGIVLVGEWVVEAIYQRNAFESSDTIAVASVLTWFAIGLPAYTINRIYTSLYNSRRDMKAPLRAAYASFFINIVSSLALLPWYGYVGIAMAAAISAWGNSLMLMWGLIQKDGWDRFAGLMVPLGKLMGISALFALGVYVAQPWLRTSYESKVGLGILVTLSALMWFALSIGVGMGPRRVMSDKPI